MNTVIENVMQWFHNKGILANSNPLKQLEKTQEELTKTRDAALRLKWLVFFAKELEIDHYWDQYRASIHEIKHGIGDTVVTLIGVCEMYNITLEECLQQAYDVSKGTMIDGKFVKEGGEA